MTLDLDASIFWISLEFENINAAKRRHVQLEDINHQLYRHLKLIKNCAYYP